MKTKMTMTAKGMIDDLLRRGKIEPNEHVALQLMRAKEKLNILPSDDEVAEFFNLNIPVPEECSSSSAIYKFRLWLKDRIHEKDNDKNENDSRTGEGVFEG